MAATRKDPSKAHRPSRRRIGPKVWLFQFNELLANDTDAKAILHSWTSLDVPEDFIVRAISLHCLAPYPAARRADFDRELRITRLTDQMESLAAELELFLNSPTGSDLWLANCYFAHNSVGLSVLLGFCDAESGRLFHPFHHYAGSLARTGWGPFRSGGVTSG